MNLRSKYMEGVTNIFIKDDKICGVMFVEKERGLKKVELDEERFKDYL